MASVNKVIIIGNLGRDPEIMYTQANVPVATLSVATTESWKDKDSGEWQEKTEWHRVKAWRHLAERAEKYFRKGKQVYIDGSLETRKYTDKEGVERWTTEIVARQAFTTGRDEEKGKPAGVDKDTGHFQPPAPPEDDDDDDSLPFEQGAGDTPPVSTLPPGAGHTPAPITHKGMDVDKMNEEELKTFASFLKPDMGPSQKTWLAEAFRENNLSGVRHMLKKIWLRVAEEGE